MINKIRYRIALRWIKKSTELIETGEFRKIMKGLEYYKYSLIILPDDRIKRSVLAKFNDIIRGAQT